MNPNSRTILIIEDNADDATLIREAFRRSGFDNPIHTTHTREQSFAYLNGEREYANREKFPFPQMIMLDHKMPGDGWAIIEWVRDRPDLDWLPVLILSGSDDPNHQRQAFDLGVNAYHVKPVLFEEFVATIKRIGEFWRLGDHPERRRDG